MTATLDTNVSGLIPTAVEYVRNNGAKLVKFLVVTGGSVVMGQLILAFLLYALDWPGLQANLTSAAIMVMPNYLANRYWVWGKRSENSFKREVLPFWIMAGLGVLFSSVAVAFADAQGWPNPVLLLANLIAYGVVWVFKFFVMERFLFGASDDNDPATLETVAA